LITSILRPAEWPDNVVGFARALRAAGISGRAGAVIDALNALQVIEDPATARRLSPRLNPSSSSVTNMR